MSRNSDKISYNNNALDELKRIYALKKDAIEARISEFKNIWENADDEQLFAELSFCLLTPQSKAKMCWNAVENLRENNLLKSGSAEKISRKLFGVRFKYTKSENIVLARRFFGNGNGLKIRSIVNKFTDSFQLREYLVKNVRGMGYKESSHFLRNIFIGRELAILDRHILKNLVWLGVIEEVPKSLTFKKYIAIENKMKNLSDIVNISMSHLDLILWFKQTGRIFK